LAVINAGLVVLAGVAMGLVPIPATTHRLHDQNDIGLSLEQSWKKEVVAVDSY
jgi:hypothetical protein